MFILEKWTKGRFFREIQYEKIYTYDTYMFVHRHTLGHDERKRYCETFPFIFKVRKGQVFKVADFKAQIKEMIFLCACMFVRYFVIPL